MKRKLMPLAVDQGCSIPLVPWEMLAPHEAQAQRNHGGQSLERLAQRGGLDPCEALAILDDKPWGPEYLALAEPQCGRKGPSRGLVQFLQRLGQWLAIEGSALDDTQEECDA